VFFAGNIVIPIVFSGIVSVFLFPILKRLERLGMNRFFATFTTVLAVSIVLLALMFVMGYESQHIISNLPKMELESGLFEPIALIEETMNIKIASTYDSYISSAIRELQTVLGDLLPKAVTSLKDTMVFFITCPIYVFFMLLYSENVRNFYFSLFSGARKERAKTILFDINGAYAAYIKGMLVVILIVAVLTSTGLAIIGIDYAIFLGMLAGLLTLIPYIGVFISALIPIAIALATKDSGWYAIGVIGVFAVVQFLEGNLITPKIVGNRVGVNPLAIIVGIVILGSIGGVAGMIITIPLLALLKIIAEHVPAWRPVRLLLQV